MPSLVGSEMCIRDSYNGKSKEVSLLGGRGYVNNPKKVTIDDLDFYLSYGSDAVSYTHLTLPTIPLV